MVIQNCSLMFSAPQSALDGQLPRWYSVGRGVGFFILDFDHSIRAGGASSGSAHACQVGWETIAVLGAVGEGDVSMVFPVGA